MNSIRRFSMQKFPFYLILLPLFFVFHGFVDYYDIVRLNDVLRLLALYSTASLLLWGLAYLLFHCWQKAALFAFSLLCFHFFFGSLHDLLKNTPGTALLAKYSFVLPFSLVFFIGVFYFLKKTKGPFLKLSRYLNILLLVLIASDVPPLATKLGWNSAKRSAGTTTFFTACDTCSKPDIYLIIADEYAGQTQLKELFQFDNSGFENALRKRGFHLVQDARSNYNSSPFSVASMFNMNYLEGIEGDDDKKHDVKLCFEQINRNNMVRFFKGAGYQLINYSIFNFDHQPSTNLIPFFPTNDRLISAQTFWSRLERDLFFHLHLAFDSQPKINRPYYDVLRSNEENIAQLQREVSRMSLQPRFVYTHVMMPHYPYYFDKEGNPFPAETIGQDGPFGKESNYVSYLQYSNKKFLTLIDHILLRSKIPPIIIFMSDHGFRFYNPSLDLKYQFMNINAVFLPNKNFQDFYTGLSNVNQFRVLLNAAFGQKLPILKDSTIFIK
jgi:hypothetical protein